MTQKKPIPARLSEETLRRLDVAADKLHLQHRSDVIRFSVKTFLDYLDRNGVESLWPGYAEELRNMDGRRTQSPSVHLTVTGNGNHVSADPRIAAESRAEYTTPKKRRGKKP